jgi:predicted DNA binding CopG/RHH family protein
MKREYDFSRAKRNPYSRLLKRQVTIRLDEETVKYFKETAKEAGIPYQTLINLYLRDCAASNRKLRLRWETTPAHDSRTSFSTAR